MLHTSEQECNALWPTMTNECCRRPLVISGYVRRMPGGSQPHLVRATDGKLYVAKFLGNPQHSRILVNEWIASRLAIAVGLPAARVRLITLTREFVASTPELCFQLRRGTSPCRPGVHLGSAYVGVPGHHEVLDLFPPEISQRLANKDIFAAALVLDKWLGNADARQFVFRRALTCRQYKAFLIDQGGCFNFGKWDFPDCPRYGLARDRWWYAGITNLGDFEPYLSRVEHVTASQLSALVAELPECWRSRDKDALERLMEQVFDRAARIRCLVRRSVEALPAVFPNWLFDRDAVRPLSEHPSQQLSRALCLGTRCV
ncbi:MAG: HipA family kinase [Terriglobales bacterium]